MAKRFAVMEFASRSGGRRRRGMKRLSARAGRVCPRRRHCSRNERTQAAMHARLRSPKPEDDQTSGLLMKARRCASNGLA